jgi:hypothetical protein
MEHQTINRSSHDNERNVIACGVQRLTIKAAADITGFKRQAKDDAFVPANDTNLNYQEYEHQYRQRWKIE